MNPAAFDLSKLPALLDVAGVNKHLAPMSRSMLYRLANDGEITPVNIGTGRGKRAYLTETIVAYLQRRLERRPTPPPQP